MRNLFTELLIDPLALLFILVLFTGFVLVVRRLLSGESWLATLLLMLGPISAFLITGAPSIVNPLLERTESHIKVDAECIRSVTPLVVLSGGVSSSVASATDFSTLYHSSFVRLSKARELAGQEGDDSLVYLVGGSVRNNVAESDVMAAYFRATGFDPDRIVQERQSDNTAESAIDLARVFQSSITQTDNGGSDGQLGMKIRLVTSALHMSRAAFVYQNAGFDVCPVHVDRLAVPDVPFYYLMPQSTAFRKFDLLLHEWIGNIVYRLKASS